MTYNWELSRFFNIKTISSAESVHLSVTCLSISVYQPLYLDIFITIMFLVTFLLMIDGTFFILILF